MGTPPSHQNRMLLFIETQLILMATTALLVTGLYLFITAATQKRRSLITFFRTIFHLPFAAAIVYGASLAFQGPLSVLSGQGVGIGIAATLGFVYALNALYGNMVSAAARDDDEAGLIILHHVFRFFADREESTSSPQDLTSGMELQSLGNVHAWLSQMARSHHTCQVHIPSEEEETLLGHDLETGDKTV
ncbi:hypothetical protein OG21DRAFT_1511567, partial [Imleria badia]